MDTSLYNLTSNGTNCTDPCTDVREEEISEFLNWIQSDIIPVIHAFLLFFGVVGNLLFIIVVLSDKHRNTTHVFIVGLATSDLVYLITSVPFMILQKMSLFGGTWCSILYYVMMLTCYVSIYLLVLMSIDRYFAFVHAIKARRFRSKKYAYTCVLTTWIIMLLVNIPVFFVVKLYTGESHNQTYTYCAVQQKAIRGLTTTFFVFGYAVPLCFIVTLNSLTLRRLHTSVHDENQTAKIRIQRTKNISKLIFTVVVSFILCWLPFHIMIIAIGYNLNLGLGLSILNIMADSFIFLNCFINPIIYVFLSDNFRKGLKRIFCQDRSMGKKTGTERRAEVGTLRTSC